jgi:transcriptional regulator with XRE-family HTH domain
MGLTQDQAADLIGVNRGTFKAWDRGRRPRDPELLQVISEAFETPIPVLWPTDENPIAAESLRALRDLQAAKAADQAAHGQTEIILESDASKASVGSDTWVSEQPAEVTPPPVTGTTPYGLHRQIEATFDGKDDVAPGITPPARRRRRLLIPAVVSALAVAAAGTAIATAGGGEDTPTRPAAPVAQTGPTAAERDRAAQQATLQQAKERGDFDRAISIAVRLHDTAATTDLRQTAAGILARRARSAAYRGDLPLATSRLAKAEKRYGQVPETEAVRRRIEAIKSARARRAAARKRAARRRAEARARAAAASAARRQPPSKPDASPPAQPSSPTPNASPTPASPTPAPSTGGGSSSGGGSGSGSKPADDPFDF